jgi:ketosteroid isomerase-like protein
MSQQNVEIARGFYAAWNGGDMDAIREFYDPDVVIRTTENWPERGPYFGREAVVSFIARLRDTWDVVALEPISFIDAGDRIVARQVVRGMGAGPESNIEVTTITTMRQGKTILVEFFWDHAEALEAVGLSE